MKQIVGIDLIGKNDEVRVGVYISWSNGHFPTKISQDGEKSKNYLRDLDYERVKEEWMKKGKKWKERRC